MSETDQNKICEIITEHLVPQMNDQLLQVILYNDKDPHSDDILIISRSSDLFIIKKAQICINKLIKKRVPIPFFMTPEFITSSLDSYPLEFLNMQNDYINLYQTDETDYIKPLRFEKQWVRLQIERELKSKYLLISSNYMAVNSSKSALKQLVSGSILSLKPILKGILYLDDLEISPYYEDLIERIEKTGKIELKTLRRAFEIRYDKVNFKQLNTDQFFDNYLQEIVMLYKSIENR